MTTTSRLKSRLVSLGIFTRFANAAAYWMGRPIVFTLALATVILWAALGPIYHYSDTWQLVINTGTTIVIFLMVFLIQHSQTRDTLAIQIKLSELVLLNRELRTDWQESKTCRMRKWSAFKRRTADEPHL